MINFFDEIAVGSNLSFPYDEEIFNYDWKNTPDIYLTNMIQSGAVVEDAEIARLISNGSNYFTTPFYDILGGTEDVYNGVNDFTDTSLSGGHYSGVVYGRMKKWSAKSFIKDFNSGADPMAQIVAGVATYWIKKRQERLLGILNGVFGITGDTDWALHTTDISAAGNAQSEKLTVTNGCTTNGNITVTVTSSGMTGSPLALTVAVTTAASTADAVATLIRAALNANTTITGRFTVSGTGAEVILTSKTITAYDASLNIAVTPASTGVTAGISVDNTTAFSVTDANKMGETTVNDAIIKSNGDNAQNYSLAIMHSVIANRLANLQLLNYSKYTDAAGITRNLPIATINGLTVIVNDLSPVVGSPVFGYSEYTTYVLGLGAIRYAQAPVDVPSEMDRDPNKYGGLDMIYTRIRECISPNGFSFIGDHTTDVGIPDATLFASASYERKMPAKSIFMTKIVTN